MTRGPVTSAAAAERAVRQRWHERNVPARILTPDDPGASPYVLHCAPRHEIEGDDPRTVPAHVVPDVIARCHAMRDAAVTIVASGDGTPDDECPPLGERLACLPVGEHYRTTDPAYLDSVWWALAQLWEAGLLYESPHRFAWCVACAAVADIVGGDEVEAEVTSAVVRFPVAGDTALGYVGASLLVDVAEPWTVPATAAVRIDPERAYVLAQAAADDYPVVLARTAVAAALGASATIHRDVSTAELLAVRFRPPSAAAEPTAPLPGAPVVADTRPAAIPGTGMVPVTPACAVDDWRLATDHGLPCIDVIGHDGRLTAAAGVYEGVALGDADHVVVADLLVRGLVVRTDHRMRPTGRCASCRHAVVSRARPVWLVATTRLRDRLRAERGAIAGLSAGAERRWAAGDGDWPVAWPAAHGPCLPLWRCAGCARVTAVDGRGTLLARTGHPPTGHPPAGVDPADRELPCDRCDGTAHLVPYAVDPLVVAAAMPFARFGFPAEPGSDTDVAHRAQAHLLIDTATPPGRWTDAVIALSVLLWDAAGHDAALRTDHGSVPVGDPAGSDGPVLSDLIDGHGVDAVRLAALTEPRGWRVAARRATLAASAGRTLDGLRTACDALMATAGEWTPGDLAQAAEIDRRDVLDRWMLAELAHTVSHVRRLVDVHDVVAAGQQVRRFVTQFTHWYLPQQRRALARAGSGAQQRGGPSTGLPTRTERTCAATATTHECLVTVCALLAPFAPVISDALYDALVRSVDATAPDSVHLLRYPTADPTARNDAVRDAMAAARRIVALGGRARRAAGIDPARPLPRAAVGVTTGIAGYWDALTPLLADALSVARLVPRPHDGAQPADAPSGHQWHTVRDDEFVVALAVPDDADDRRSERLARQVVGAVNDLRSQQAIDRDQRITVRIDAGSEIAAVVERHRQAIAADVLATRIEVGPTMHGEPVPLGDVPIRMTVREVATR